jgi:hypothetical protein
VLRGKRPWTNGLMVRTGELSSNSKWLRGKQWRLCMYSKKHLGGQQSEGTPVWVEKDTPTARLCWTVLSNQSYVCLVQWRMPFVGESVRMISLKSRTLRCGFDRPQGFYQQEMWAENCRQLLRLCRKIVLANKLCYFFMQKGNGLSV